ncbi:MAG TPA: ABC transporter permease, partial [Mycobacteriales bacterium]|nr:ABC transporter permease [Mycobacteriales bacterium]
TTPAAPPRSSAATPSSPRPEPRRARRTAGQLVGQVSRQYSLPILLGVSVLLYSTWGKTGATFATVANWQNMASSQAVTGVLTLGILITLVSGNFDLSIGNIAGLSSVMTAAAYSHWHFPLVAGLLFGVALGAAVGGLNGFLTTLLRVDPFIITLGTASIILGFIDWYTHGQSIINGIPVGLVEFGRTKFLGVPYLAWVLGAVALVIYYLLEHTPYGRKLHAIGSNRAAARLIGVRVERTITSAFALTGAFAGVAGVLLLAQTGSGNPTIGPTFTLAALASAFLGAVSFKVGRLNVPGTLVAIFFLSVNITGLTFAGVQNWINQVFTGLTLILAVALAAVLSKERKARHGPAAAGATAPELTDNSPPRTTEETRNPA